MVVACKHISCKTIGRTSNASTDDDATAAAWCWIRANIVEIYTLFFLFSISLLSPLLPPLLLLLFTLFIVLWERETRKSIDIWHTSMRMCDNKTHMTWIRFTVCHSITELCYICLHGLFPHFPNGVHISISRNGPNLSHINWREYSWIKERRRREAKRRAPAKSTLSEHTYPFNHNWYMQTNPFWSFLLHPCTRKHAKISSGEHIRVNSIGK